MRILKPALTFGQALLQPQRAILDLFVPERFSPPAWPMDDAHVQTILGSGDIRTAVASHDDLPLRRVTYCLSESRSVECDWLYPEALGAQKSEKRSLVVLLHGLEGSSRAPATQIFAKELALEGFDVACLNFPSCEENALSEYQQLDFYNLAYTQLLSEMLPLLKKQSRLVKEKEKNKEEREEGKTLFRFPALPPPLRFSAYNSIYLSGFSLGANVCVKWLGEVGKRAAWFGVAGAAVCCVPFRPQESVKLLRTGGFIRSQVYTPSFLKTLKQKVLRAMDANEDDKRLRGIRKEDVARASSFEEFDEAFTYKFWGFKSLEDYYDHACAKQDLSRIAVPSLILNSDDDPFTDSSHGPSIEDLGSAPVQVVYHQRGGHVGFWSLDSGGLKRFLPCECARFLKYLDENKGVDVMKKRLLDLVGRKLENAKHDGERALTLGATTTRLFSTLDVMK